MQRYTLAPIIRMAGHFVRGLLCRIIRRSHCTITTWMATNAVIVGYGANNLLPARIGQLEPWAHRVESAR